MAEVSNLPTKAGEMKSGGKVQAIIPQSMEDAYRLAKAVSISGLAPKGFDKPEAIMIAIMHGLEIGLTPMMALQKIAVINGRPTLWGDGALALVRSSGLCKYVKETLSGTGDARVATCQTLRSGEQEPITRTFSVADAKKAGLWGKQGPWTNFPERMLQMRARAFALRDGFADVLGGMYLTEELQGEEPNHYTAGLGPRIVPPPALSIIPPEAPTSRKPTTDADLEIPASLKREQPKKETNPSGLPGDWQDYLDRQIDEYKGSIEPLVQQGVVDAVTDAITGAQERGELSAADAERVAEAWNGMIGS